MIQTDQLAQDEQVLFTNSLSEIYKLISGVESIEHEEESFYYRNIVDTIVKKSDIFQGVNPEPILRALTEKRIKINYVSPGNSFIPEGNSNCNHLFLLLKGELEITFGDSSQKVIIDGMTVVGEIGYINPELKRTATVKSKNGAHVIMLTRSFIESLGTKEQSLINQNLSRVIATRLAKTTNKLRGNDKGGEEFKNVLEKTSGTVGTFIFNARS